ncbi:MAG TPA: sigma-70 family RNA polymerase sigma factor [Candidatus Acidoferrales bacterium]|nr:sigma-70 family RNA polymerase sigma factor [Candidatus Acidoferrales bacterium]
MSAGGATGPRDTREQGSQGTGSADEARLLEGLRQGDEDAFLTLVKRYQPLLKRVARMYVRSDAVAEEVVQETWLGVFQGIERFEGRASLKTWVVRILMNRARSRGERESRMIPFSALVGDETGGSDPAVALERFQDAAGEYPGHWAAPLPRWGENPEQWVCSLETLEYLRGAIQGLPNAQRMVVTLRDEQEWTAEEVCEALGITEANQRVLLHRGRSKLRRALESRNEGQAARP